MNNSIKNWRETKKLHKLLGKKGKVVTWTKVTVAPAGFDGEVPYLVAIIKLENIGNFTAQVVDFEADLEIGQKVITVIRRLNKPGPADNISYGIKVKPI